MSCKKYNQMIEKIKERYHGKISQLEHDYDAGLVSDRRCYENLRDISSMMSREIDDCMARYAGAIENND